MEALTERAAAIPKIDLAAPRALIGKSTVEAIRSGVIYGFAGMVDGILARLRARARRGDERSRPAGSPSAIVPVPASRSTTSTTCSRSPACG